MSSFAIFILDVFSKMRAPPKSIIYVSLTLIMLGVKPHSSIILNVRTIRVNLVSLEDATDGKLFHIFILKLTMKEKKPVKSGSNIV